MLHGYFDSEKKLKQVFLIQNSSSAIVSVSRPDGYDVYAVVEGIQCDAKHHLATAFQFLVHPNARAVERTQTSDVAIRGCFRCVHAVS